MSLGDLSGATGIAKSYLSRLERGESLNLGLATLATLAKAFGTTVHDLLPRREPLDDTGEGSVEARPREVQFESVKEHIPVPLQAFIEDERNAGRPVPEDAVRAMSLLQARGKRPKSKEDYALLYNLLRRVI